MKKSDKIIYLIDTLELLFPEVPIPLDHKDPYTLLIAVLLSAQSTDVGVIRDIIRPVGLSPMKSKGIYGLSKILIENHNGKVPENFEDLESLPAVGHKTASVVLAQAFNIPTFPVDTHIHRLMYRWGMSSGKNVKITEKDAKRIFPKKLWNKLHLQIIWYGRKFSPARGWNIKTDLITQKIGRKSFLKKLIN